MLHSASQVCLEDPIASFRRTITEAREAIVMRFHFRPSQLSLAYVCACIWTHLYIIYNIHMCIHIYIYTHISVHTCICIIIFLVTTGQVDPKVVFCLQQCTLAVRQLCDVTEGLVSPPIPSPSLNLALPEAIYPSTLQW